MRGSRAKKIRKEVYGDFSPTRKLYANIRGTIINVGKRREYLDAKKKYKAKN